VISWYAISDDAAHALRKWSHCVAKKPFFDGTKRQIPIAAMENPRAGTSVFVERVALAFHAPVRHTYRNLPVASVSDCGGLALWQLRRACEFIEANFNGDPSVADIAVACRAATSARRSS
jgi:hypothetical protein